MKRATTPDYDLFGKILEKITDGMTIVFTPDNIAEGDDFLLFGSWRKSVTVSFRYSSSGLVRCYFDGNEPMLLEDTPESFWRSIEKNLGKANIITES